MNNKLIITLYTILPSFGVYSISLLFNSNLLADNIEVTQYHYYNHQNKANKSSQINEIESEVTYIIMVTTLLHNSKV